MGSMAICSNCCKELWDDSLGSTAKDISFDYLLLVAFWGLAVVFQNLIFLFLGLLWRSWLHFRLALPCVDSQVAPS
jgi:hypothetical protein